MSLTEINIGGIAVMEPVTALTDLIVSAVCFIAFYKLKQSVMRSHIVLKLYRYFFLSMGLATLLGGLIGHAFLHYLSFEWKLPGWVISMLSVALAERAAIMHARPLMQKQLGVFFAWTNVIELITFILLAMFTLHFIYVEIHAVYGLLIVMASFELFVYWKKKDTGSRLVLWSVLFAFAAAVVHLLKFSLHTWFNYLDLSHVFMAISSYVLYRGVMQMKLY